MTMTPSQSRNRRTKSNWLADTLAQAIEQGQWQAGDRLPTVRELVNEHHVSLYAAQAAMQELADRGVVELISRQGAFVKSAPASRGNKNKIGLIVGYAKPEDQRPNRWPTLDDWRGRIFWAFHNEVQQAGYQVLTHPLLASDDEPIPALFKRMESDLQDLAGIAVYAERPDMVRITERLDALDLPWATVNPISPDWQFNFVEPDHQFGGMQTGYALARSGRQRVLAIATPTETSVSSEERLLGLYQGFLHAGAPTNGIDIIQVRDIAEEAGYQSMRHYLANHDLPPQAVMTSGDWQAFGVMKACREAGLSIPEQVNIIGGTGLDAARISNPSLSVIAQPMEQVGTKLAQAITLLAQKGLRRFTGLRLPARLIVRDSMDVSPQVIAELEEQFNERLKQLPTTETLDFYQQQSSMAIR